MEKYGIVARTRALTIVLPLSLLLGIGMVMVYDSSVAEAERLFHNKYYFVERHAIWVGLGILALAFISRVPTSLFQKVGPIFFFGTIVLLFAVLIPGISSRAQGARRWIRIGSSLSIQPSEIAKLTSVLYLATWLKQKPKAIHFFALCGLLVGLLMAQPDFGTAMIMLSTGFLMFFLSGATSRSLLWSVGAAGLAIAGLIAVAPYRLQRLTTYFNQSADRLGSGYHINQALLALGSGGFWGLGLGRSREKFQYLPEASTDSVFAVIGEEMGFAGASVVIMLFAYLFYQLFHIVAREQDDFRRLMGAGLAGWLAIQVVVNIGAMVALLPLTGVPLPFISYGGSSLIAQLLSVGIILRIALTQT